MITRASCKQYLHTVGEKLDRHIHSRDLTNQPKKKLARSTYTLFSPRFIRLSTIAINCVKIVSTIYLFTPLLFA